MNNHCPENSFDISYWILAQGQRQAHFFLPVTLRDRKENETSACRIITPLSSSACWYSFLFSGYFTHLCFQPRSPDFSPLSPLSTAREAKEREPGMEVALLQWRIQSKVIKWFWFWRSHPIISPYSWSHLITWGFIDRMIVEIR